MAEINERNGNVKSENIRMRCHFSIIFESLWQFWAVIAIAMVGEIDTVFQLIEDIGKEGLSEMLEGGALWGLLVLLLITAAVLGLQFLRWRQTWISLEDNLIIVEKNTLNRKRNTIAVENLSAVNIERNIFERLVGTCRIKMDTNSMTTAQETDVSIVFAEKKAMEFRNAVIERMNVVNGTMQEQVKAQYEDAALHPQVAENIRVFTYSPMEIAKHNLFSASIFNIIAVVGGIIGTVWLYTSPNTPMDNGGSLGTFFAIVVFIGGLAYNLVKKFIVYYNFSVYRDGDDIHLKYGLIKIKNYTVPIDKITAIKIVQPTLSRLAKLYQVQIITVGLGDEDGEMTNLIMAVPKEKMAEQMKELLPEYDIENFDIHIKKEESGAMKIKAVKSLKWVIITIAAVSLAVFSLDIRWYIAVGAGALLMAFIYSLYVLAHITAGYYDGQELLILSDGHYAREYSVCKYSKIQIVNTTSGPLERKLGLVDGDIELLNTSANIPYVKPEVIDKITKCVLKKGQSCKTN